MALCFYFTLLFVRLQSNVRYFNKQPDRLDQTRRKMTVCCVFLIFYHGKTNNPLTQFDIFLDSFYFSCILFQLSFCFFAFSRHALLIGQAAKISLCFCSGQGPLLVLLRLSSQIRLLPLYFIWTPVYGITTTRMLRLSGFMKKQCINIRSANTNRNIEKACLKGYSAVTVWLARRIKKSADNAADFPNGGEENRTPVRKQILKNFSERSHSFEIPSDERRMTGFHPR